MTDSQPQTRLDVYLQRGSQAAQLVLVVVAVVGYLYTVRPIFQHQRLQEDAARLESENSESQKELALLSQQRLELESALAAQEDALNRASWELLKVDMFTATRQTDAFFAPISFESAMLLIQRTPDYRVMDFFSKFWISPYHLLLEALPIAQNTGSSNKIIPAGHYKSLRQQIYMNAEHLQCTPPDFRAIALQHIAELKKLDPGIADELEYFESNGLIFNQPILLGPTAFAPIDYTSALSLERRTLLAKYYGIYTSLWRECADKFEKFLLQLRQEDAVQIAADSRESVENLSAARGGTIGDFFNGLDAANELSDWRVTYSEEPGEEGDRPDAFNKAADSDNATAAFDLVVSRTALSGKKRVHYRWRANRQGEVYAVSTSAKEITED